MLRPLDNARYIAPGLVKMAKAAAVLDMTLEEVLGLRLGRPVLLVTATEVETRAVLARFKALPEQVSLIRVSAGNNTFHVGSFAGFAAVHVQCAAGSIGRDSATIVVAAAVERWKPPLVLMPGIAFGKSPRKQLIGDVLIANEVVHYEPFREGAKRIARGAHSRATPVARDRAVNLRWSQHRSDGRRVRARVGQMLSGEKLVDSIEFKARLFADFPEAIGGEMEGAGLASAAEAAKIEWLLAKAICDWGNGKKSDKYQKEAAKLSVRFMEHLLGVRHGFKEIDLISLSDRAPSSEVIDVISLGDAKASMPRVRDALSRQAADLSSRLRQRVAYAAVEILLNAFQHGGAKKARVTISSDGLVLEDDGAPFDISKLKVGQSGGPHRGGAFAMSLLRDQHPNEVYAHRSFALQEQTSNTIRFALIRAVQAGLAEKCQLSWTPSTQLVTPEESPVFQWNATCQELYIDLDNSTLALSCLSTLIDHALAAIGPRQRLVVITSDVVLFSEFLLSDPRLSFRSPA